MVEESTFSIVRQDGPMMLMLLMTWQDVFVAGDDEQAKARVSAFVESLEMHPMDAGQLPMARALENATLLQLGLITHSVKNTNHFLGVSILS